MNRIVLISLFITLCIGFAGAQGPIKPESLVKPIPQESGQGQAAIYQDASIDTLLGRFITRNKAMDGMEGVRIQIYRGSGRNAREEANQAKAKFISDFPGVEAYVRFDPPNYFKVRVGDFRTRHEATALLYKVSPKFPQAYIVKDIINFPLLNK